MELNSENSSSIEGCDTTTGISSEDALLALKNSPPWGQQFYFQVVPFIGVLIVVTNLTVVVSSGLIVKKRLEPQGTYLLLGNISLADLVMGVMMTIGATYPRSQEVRSHYGCCILYGIMVSSALASGLSAGLIALDRFLYIIHGLRYHQLVYVKRVRFVIMSTWKLGAFIGFLPLMGWSRSTLGGSMCWLTDVAPPGLLILMCVIQGSSIILVVSLYGIILRKALTKISQLKTISSDTERSMQENQDSNEMRIFKGSSIIYKTATIDTYSENPAGAYSSNSETAKDCKGQKGILQQMFKIFKRKTKVQEAYNNSIMNAPSKYKAIKVILLMTNTYVLTWIPFIATCIIYIQCDAEDTPSTCHILKKSMTRISSTLVYINCLINPIIYAWWHNGFREAAKKFYCRKKDVFANNQNGNVKKPFTLGGCSRIILCRNSNVGNVNNTQTV